MRKSFFTLLVAVYSVLAIQAQTVRYVVEGGDGDGSSWENAAGDIQRMINELDEAGEGGEIRVAQGKYIPTQKVAEIDIDGVATTERDKAFLLKSNINLYGGYVGTGNNPDLRDFELYTSVLDGGINETDTAYHVVVGGGVNNLILDGFTIANGRGLYSFENPAGTGLTFANVKLNDIDFSRNRAGGVYLQNCFSIQLNNLSIQHHWALYMPGFSVHSCTDIKFKNSIIANNQNLIGISGAGFLQNSTTVMTQVNFNSNQLNGDQAGGAGALYQQGGDLRIEDSVFENNKSIRHGALYLSSGTTELEGVYIRNNIGSLDGNILGAGGVASYNALTCKNVWVENNVGSQGGGMYLNNGQIILDNVTIQRNVANVISKANSGTGGGICYVYGSQGLLKITNSIISDNISEGTGGAIFAQSGGLTDFDIFSSEIRNNKSKLNGGAIHLVLLGQNYFNLNIESSLVLGNEVTGADAESPTLFYMDKARPVKLNLINSTIVDNKITGSGYAIVDHANVTIQNSVLWNNLNGSNAESNMDAAVASTIQNSLIGGMDLSTSNNNLDGTLSEGHYFVNAADGDYSLLPWYSNPAINAGDDSFIDESIIKDATGNARFVNTVDIGAYEAQNVVAPFTGGTLNEENEREFTYTGNPAALSLLENMGGTASFTYQGLEEWATESGNDLPADAGLYTVTATISGGDYDGAITSTTIRINKAELALDFPEIPAMRVGDADKGTYTLTASNSQSLPVEFNIQEGTSVDLNDGVLTATAEGNSIVVASLTDNRNYTCSTPPARTVYVQSAANDDATLAIVNVNGHEAVWETDKYKVSVTYSETLTVNGIPTSTLSTVTDDSAGKSLTAGETVTITLMVKAEDNSTENYTLEVYTLQNITTLETVAVNGVRADLADNAYTVTIPYALEATVMYTPTAGSGATVTNGTTLKNLILGNNIRSFTVVAEDGTQATYQLTVKVLNNNANLKTITLRTAESQEAAEVSTNTNGDYAITVAYTTEIILTAIALDANATVNGSGTFPVNKGENQFTVSITSEDRSDTKSYTVKVTVPLNSDTSLKEANGVMVNNRAASLRNGQYEYTLTSSEATKVTITANATDAAATVTGTGEKDVVMGANTFILTVTAEDGTIGYHTLVVTVTAPSPSDPDPAPAQPVVTITGELPEGVTIEPGLGEHNVNEGQSLTLTITMGDQYDGMYVFLQIDEEYILLDPVLRSSVYRYTIENIRKNMTIRIHVSNSPDPNPDPTDNATIGGTHLWTAGGCLYIQTNSPADVYLVSMAGRIVTSRKIPAGETSISLAKGIYMVKVDNNVTKIIVR